MNTHDSILDISNCNGNSNSNIAAIGNRIQDRANQLSNEHCILQQLQSQLTTIQNKLSTEQQNYDDKRRQYLLQTQSLHEKEINIYKYKQLIQNYEKVIQNTTKEIHTLEHQMDIIQEECHLHTTNIYVPHQYETILYKRNLEQNVSTLKTKRRKREETLTNVRNETNQNQQEVQSMEREVRKIRDEIKMMEEVEVREDEEIAAVAMQIRATLAKRVSLRTALKEAQERNKEANDDMTKWEEECFNLSNAATSTNINESNNHNTCTN